MMNNSPGQVCDAGVMDVRDISKWCGVLSVIEYHRVQTGHCVYHAIGKTASIIELE